MDALSTPPAPLGPCLTKLLCSNFKNRSWNEIPCRRVFKHLIASISNPRNYLIDKTKKAWTNVSTGICSLFANCTPCNQSPTRRLQNAAWGRMGFKLRWVVGQDAKSLIRFTHLKNPIVLFKKPYCTMLQLSHRVALESKESLLVGTVYFFHVDIEML